MAGVTTASGERAPSSTTDWTCATVSLGGRRHHRVEVPPAVLVGEVAPTVAFPGLDQGDVARQGVFQHAVPPADRRRRLALGELRAEGRSVCRRRECPPRPPACARPACPAAPVPTRSCRRGRVPRTRTSRRNGETSRRCAAPGRASSAWPGRTRQRPELLATIDQVLGALLDQAVDELVGLPHRAEAANQDGCAIGDPRPWPPPSVATRLSIIRPVFPLQPSHLAPGMTPEARWAG